MGDRIKFKPTGFHTVDLPGKADTPTLPLFTSVGTKADSKDASGADFWLTGKLDNVGFNPALLAGLYGKHVTSYLGAIAKSFEGAPVLDARGVYPSDATVASFSSALHGHRFWNTGVMDNSAASSAEVKFTHGTYTYYCLNHSFLKGQVVVTP